MWLYIVLSVIGGIGIAAQALINSRLQSSVGNPILAAGISFAVGLLALAAVLLVQPVSTMQGRALLQAPWWAWTGGILGAFYIVASILALPRIGAAATLSAVVLGNVSFSLLADHFGLFGVPVHAVNPRRAVGAALVMAGVALVRLF